MITDNSLQDQMLFLDSQGNIDVQITFIEGADEIWAKTEFYEDLNRIEICFSARIVKHYYIALSLPASLASPKKHGYSGRASLETGSSFPSTHKRNPSIQMLEDAGKDTRGSP